MSFDDNPDAQYIVDFAKKKKEEWGPQAEDDTRIYKLFQRQEEGEVAEPASQANQIKLRKLRTGRAGVARERNKGVLAQTPGRKVHPLKSADVKSVRHADGVLEPFFAFDWEHSQVGEVWEPAIGDLVTYSRFWLNKFPIPGLWGSKEYRKLTEKMVGLNNDRAEADDDQVREIESERVSIQSDIDSFLEENYPLRMRYLPARFTWHQQSDERYLPEVVEVRTVTLDQIKADYPSDKTNDIVDMGGQGLKLFIYHNWLWTKTVVEHNEATILREWEHDLGMNPCVLGETNIILDEPGKRWRSPMYDHIDMLEAENEILTDLRHNHRRNTLAGPKITVDPQLRGITGSTNNLEHEIEYNPGEPLFLLKGEEEGLQTVSTVNPQSIELLQFIANYNSEIILNPIEAGRLLSGQSAIGFATARESAQTRLDPLSAAIRKVVKRLDKLTIRCVMRLDREFEGMKIPIAGKALKIGRKEVEGWENQSQPLLSISLPISRNANMDLAVTALNLPLDPAYSLQEFLQIQNPTEQMDAWMQWQITTALVKNMVQAVETSSGELAKEPGGDDVQQLSQNIAELPPEALFALQQRGGAVNGQEVNNRMQGGVPQNAISETEVQEIV